MLYRCIVHDRHTGWFINSFSLLGCYGVPEDAAIDDETASNDSSTSTVPWFCDPCRAGVDKLVGQCILMATTVSNICLQLIVEVV